MGVTSNFSNKNVGSTVNQGWAILDLDITIIVKQNITISQLLYYLYLHQKLSANALFCQYLYLIIANLVMTKSDYDDIIRLLPLAIIVYSKNYTISIIVKENITVNRQNRLIAHPYSKHTMFTGICSKPNQVIKLILR